MDQVASEGRRWAATEQTAAYLSRSQATLRRWRVTGAGPPYYKRSGHCYYDLDEVDRWLEAGRLNHTSEESAK